jgi:hypothetical protein
MDENPYEAPQERSCTEVVSKPVSLARVARIGIVITFSTSLAACSLSVAGFWIYPRPWGSHWSAERILANQLILIGGSIAFASLLGISLARSIGLRCGVFAPRLIWTAIVLSLISIVIALTTPAA